MSIIVDWKIKPRSGVCSHSGTEFADEEPFYTCIFDDPESDGFIRRDFSLESWKEISGHLDPKPFSFWKSEYKKLEENTKQEAVKQNSAEAILHRMIEEDQPATENARYILALMLERKKILIPTEVKETETRRLLLYEHKDTGSVYIVSDPMLQLDQIGLIQQEVAELLEAEENRGSGEAVQVADDKSDPDSPQPEQNGEQPAEPEQESVPLSGE